MASASTSKLLEFGSDVVVTPDSMVWGCPRRCPGWSRSRCADLRELDAEAEHLASRAGEGAGHPGPLAVAHHRLVELDPGGRMAHRRRGDGHPRRLVAHAHAHGGDHGVGRRVDNRDGARDIVAAQVGEVGQEPVGRDGHDWCAFDPQVDRSTDQSQGTRPVTPGVRPAHQDIECILPCRIPAPVDPSMSHPRRRFPTQTQRRCGRSGHRRTRPRVPPATKGRSQCNWPSL